jgi:hypothetical protein
MHLDIHYVRLSRKVQTNYNLEQRDGGYLRSVTKIWELLEEYCSEAYGKTAKYVSNDSYSSYI